MKTPTTCGVAVVAAALTLLPHALAAATPPPGLGRVFIVNDSRDLPDLVSDGVCEAEPGTRACTLRAALDEANALGGGPHQVRIGVRSITLSTQFGRLAVNAGVNVTMWGAGATQTIIDGGGPAPGVQILYVSADARVTLHGLTLTNGVASCCGGAIQNAGNLDLSDAVISGSRATASGIVGPPGRGGAIFNEPGGRLVIATTTLANNESRGSGGAVRNDGVLLVVSSTFSANTGFAGGGGAIANAGLVQIVNSTFSGNHSAGAGAIWNDLTGRVQGVGLTLADNYTHTGGPWNAIQNDPGGRAWLADTIVYASQPGTNCVGDVHSYGFNLSNDYSCNLHAVGDWQGLDPRLGPLGDNGGPTPTHALLPGSAAIDHGLCVGTDQRGYRRPVDIPGVVNAGNACDIGAFELQRREVR